MHFPGRFWTCVSHAVDLVSPALHRIGVQTSCKCGPRGGRQVLFRPLTKLRVVTAVKNILDPAERARVDKSGFPDSVVLVQISEAEEDQEVAAASTSKKSKAGGASSSSTSAAMAEADDSDEKPVPKMAKTAAAKSRPAKKATPINPTSSAPAAAKEAKTGASSTHATEAPPTATAMPYVREHFALDDVS